MQTLYFPMYTISDIISKDGETATAVPTSSTAVPSFDGNSMGIQLSNSSPISLSAFKGTFSVHTKSSSSAPSLTVYIYVGSTLKKTNTTWTKVDTVQVGGTSYYIWSSPQFSFSQSLAAGGSITVQWKVTSGSTFNVYNGTLAIVADDLGDSLTEPDLLVGGQKP